MDREYPVLAFASQAELESWLEQNHGTSNGLWLKFAKKGSGYDTVSYVEAVETALCYGWIDGQVKALDESFYLQKLTPRRPRSVWSKINCQRAERLIAEHRMRPAGLEQVEAARSDGRWDAAYHPPSTATVPADLQEALDLSPRAKDFFAGLSSSNRYAILYRLQDAKRPETRQRRLEQFISMLEEGKSLH